MCLSHFNQFIPRGRRRIDDIGAIVQLTHSAVPRHAPHLSLESVGIYIALRIFIQIHIIRFEESINGQAVTRLRKLSRPNDIAAIHIINRFSSRQRSNQHIMRSILAGRSFNPIHFILGILFLKSFDNLFKSTRRIRSIEHVDHSLLFRVDRGNQKCRHNG